MKLRDSDLLFLSLFTDVIIINLAIFLMGMLHVSIFNVNGEDIGYYLLHGTRYFCWLIFFIPPEIFIYEMVFGKSLLALANRL